MEDTDFDLLCKGLSPDEAKRILNEEMKAETTKALPQATLDGAWKRLEITYDPVSASLLKSAEDAYRIGFLKEHPDLSRIYDLKLLNEVLREKGMVEIKCRRSAKRCWRRAIRGYGPRRRGRKIPIRISRLMGRRCIACPGWSICSASSRPA